MDREKLMFSSPDFYRFAAQGLVEEAIRRVRKREPVSEVEEWVRVCDQLAQASPDEVEEVVSSALAPLPTPAMGTASAQEVEDSESSSTDEDSIIQETEESSEGSDSEQPQGLVEEEKQVQQPQDPFGVPSSNRMGGDIFTEISKELGVNLDNQEEE